MNVDTTLTFHPLTLVPEGPDVIVGRPDIDRYVVFPPDGAELLRQLQRGCVTIEAERWYQQQYGEPVDMADFLATLRDLEFIRRPEDETPVDGRTAVASAGQWLGRAVFSPIAWTCYVALCGYALLLLLRTPGLRPHHASLFWSPSLVLTQAGVMLGQLPCIFLHEAMHVLAGRRLGVRTRIGVGNRLHMLVFETHLDGLWGVPRSARYLPLLAGMLGDALCFAALTVLADVAGPAAFPGNLLLALAYTTLLRVAWQFYLFLETDVYYVFATAFGCVNLHRTVREYLANRIRRLARRPARWDEQRWHPRDRRVVRWYAVLFVAGYTLTIGVVVLVAVPVVARVSAEIATRLATRSAFDPRFLDACLILAMNLTPVVIVAVMTLRRRLRGRN